MIIADSELLLSSDSIRIEYISLLAYFQIFRLILLQMLKNPSRPSYWIAMLIIEFSTISLDVTAYEYQVHSWNYIINILINN